MAPPKGPFVPILPLDQMILEKLPNEGTMFANAYPIGKTVRDIVKELDTDGLDSDVISTRLRVMGLYGVVTSVRAPKSHGSHSWQITSKGRTFLPDYVPLTPPPQDGVGDGDS